MANDEEPPAKRARYSSNPGPSAIVPEKTDFMMLNPDCVLKLFEYLHLTDLNAVADVNLPLHSLVAYFFRLKYRHFNCSTLFKDGLVSPDQIKKLLSTFGNQIFSLHMSRNIFMQTKTISSDLLLWVKRYCSVNVRSLTLEGFELENRLAKSLKSLFQYVETVALIDCDFQAFIWWTAENLKCLKLKSTTFRWEKLYEANFKKLQDVQLNNLLGNNPSMIRFILSVPMLKRLSIVDCNVTSSIFWTVGQLKQLEEFEFHQNQRNHSNKNFQIDLQHLTELQRLKVLRLNCEKRSVHRLLNSFVTNGISIEHLELAYGQVNDATIQSISKLSTIKILKLNAMIDLTESHIMQMTNGLTLIEELCIKTRANIFGITIKTIVQRSSELSSIKIDSPGFMLNANTYRAMVAIVRKCVKQTSLNITIYGNGRQLLVPNEILQTKENAKWVTVGQLNRDIFPHYNASIDSGDTDTDVEMNTDEENDDTDEEEIDADGGMVIEVPDDDEPDQNF